jgi:hypothetical protein
MAACVNEHNDVAPSFAYSKVSLVRNSYPDPGRLLKINPPNAGFVTLPDVIQPVVRRVNNDDLARLAQRLNLTRNIRERRVKIRLIFTDNHD